MKATKQNPLIIWVCMALEALARRQHCSLYRREISKKRQKYSLAHRISDSVFTLSMKTSISLQKWRSDTQLGELAPQVFQSFGKRLFSPLPSTALKLLGIALVTMFSTNSTVSGAPPFIKSTTNLPEVGKNNAALGFDSVAFNPESNVSATQLPEDRIIKDKAGRSLKATVLSVNETSIQIRRKSDGKKFEIPYSKLSSDDRKWAASIIHARKQKKLPKPEPKPAPIPTAPKQKNYPKPGPISSEAIMAEQRARGMVLPPEGRDALQIRLRFKDGRTVAGYVYNLRADKFWYAHKDMIQKEAALSELTAISRITIENWKNLSSIDLSPSMAFVIGGKKIHASVLSADEKQATFLTESGKLMDNVPLAQLDKMAEEFIKEWSAGNWKPDKWEWALPADFTSAEPFFNNGRALVRQNGKWGVIDLSGKFIEQPRYDQIKKIHHSPNYKISQNGKWGLLLEGGKLAIPPAWEDVGDMHHGMIPVCSAGKWGYAEEGGKLVIPCQWDSVWSFSSVGTAVVTLKGKRGFIDRRGKVIVKPEWDGAITHTPEGIAAVRRGNGWALVNRSGKLLCKPSWIFDWKDRRFELGYIPAWPMSQLGGQSFSSWWRSKQGYYSRRRILSGKTFLGIDGKPGATPKLRKGVCLPWRVAHRGLPRKPVKTISLELPFPHLSEQKSKKGLIDLNGKVIFEPEYDEVVFINSATILLKKGEQSQIYDLQGNIILEGEIGSARLLSNKSGFVVSTGGKRICYWSDWKPVLPVDQKELTYVDTYGPDLIYREGGKNSKKSWWRIDSKTRKLHRFEGASRIYWVKSLADHNRIWLEDETTKRWHFCTSEGTRLGLEMAKQPEAWFFDEGFGIMREDSKCYFVDKQGKRLSLGLWDNASIFKNGLAAVEKNGQWGVIDTSGKIVIDCQYDEVGNFFVASNDKDAKEPLLAAVCKNGKWGYINEKGHLNIPLIGDRQGHWDRNGIYLYSKEEKASYYNPHGEKVDPQEFYRRRENAGKNRFAGKWSIKNGRRGLVGLVSDSGKVALKTEWSGMAWVAPNIVAVRGKYTAGLFSTEKGWLFQDNAQRCINRRWSVHLDLSLYKKGFLRIESTPKWGYRRWRNLVPIDGLLAHYALDGDTQDFSLMGNHAVYNRIQWTKDKFGNPRSAMYLDGSEEFVSNPLIIRPLRTPQITLIGWARSDKKNGWRHLLGVANGNSIEMMSGWSARGTGGRWGCLGHRKIIPREWVFLAAQYDQDTKKVILRVNDKIFVSQVNNYRRSGPFCMGGSGGYMKFQGALDEVRVYNRLLTEDELDKLYQEFLTGKKNKKTENVE